MKQSSLAAFTGPMSQAQSMLREFIQTQKSHFSEPVRPLIDYVLAHEGKQLRALLLFYCGAEPSGNSIAPPSIELVRAAAVTELVHLATLVHDDVLDEADIRHHCQTVSRKFGTKAAVLLGDALFAQALELASSFPTSAVCKAVSESTRITCNGEIEQTLKRNTSLSQTNYFRIIEQKTAEFFALACYLGAFLKGLDKKSQQAARAFGLHLGVAYQIYDDLADIFGSEESLGKTLGTDWQTGKNTLPFVLLKEQFGPLPSNKEGLGPLFKQYAIFEQVKTIFEEHLVQASSALEVFDNPVSVPFLKEMVHFLKTLPNALHLTPCP